MQELKRKLLRVSRTSVRVLLQGEVGVGKSVLSRFIHSHSAGAVGQYRSINCAALGGSSPSAGSSPPFQGLLGALHTHDDSSPTPLIGTLFLDQVSELAPRLQQQLARSLAELDECATVEHHDDCEKMRIVSSTTGDLRRDVKRGRFRRDLFHRLVVVTIDVPPLRNHIVDLPPIADYLRLRQSAQLDVTDFPFSHDLLARMLTYRWPGNLRELENFVCRYVVLGGEDSSFDVSGADPWTQDPV